jgi:protein SCO1/2
MKKLLLLIPLFIAIFFFTQSERISLPKPETVTPFVLTQSDGSSFSDQHLDGKWSLVFFGFTYCPDICPTTLALLDVVTKQLNQTQPELPKPQVIFVSVDPERDNLAQLDKYTHYFNPNFIAITGDQAQLKSFARQLGVVFDKVSVDPKHPDEYLMEHSTSIALINPQGGIQAIFTAPHEANALAADIAKILTPNPAQ